MAKKTWIQKRDGAKAPHIAHLDKPFAGVAAGAKLLISSPIEIDTYVRSIETGAFIDPAHMRRELAARHGADATCPVSTGIFLRIIAEAAIEEHQNGAEIGVITPFWRIISPTSPTAKKLPIDQEQFELMQKLGDGA